MVRFVRLHDYLFTIDSSSSGFEELCEETMRDFGACLKGRNLSADRLIELVAVNIFAIHNLTNLLQRFGDTQGAQILSRRRSAMTLFLAMFQRLAYGCILPADELPNVAAGGAASQARAEASPPPPPTLSAASASPLASRRPSIESAAILIIGKPTVSDDVLSWMPKETLLAPVRLCIDWLCSHVFLDESSPSPDGLGSAATNGKQTNHGSATTATAAATRGGNDSGGSTANNNHNDSSSLGNRGASRTGAASSGASAASDTKPSASPLRDVTLSVLTEHLQRTTVPEDASPLLSPSKLWHCVARMCTGSAAYVRSMPPAPGWQHVVLREDAALQGFAPLALVHARLHFTRGTDRTMRDPHRETAIRLRRLVEFGEILARSKVRVVGGRSLTRAPLGPSLAAPGGAHPRRA